MAGGKQKQAAKAKKGKAKAKGKEKTGGKQRPNDKCKCGSGKKFKLCCWPHAAAGGGAGGAGGGSGADGTGLSGAAAAGGGVPYDSLGEAELRRLAQAGDADAGCLLGEALMARGEEAEAFKWVRWAAEEKAYPLAMVLLGEWYMNGKGVPQDELEGIKWARRAYETNIERGINVEDNKVMLVKVDAKISLLTDGAGPSGDGDGLEALRRLAQAGDTQAGCLLGQTLMARGDAAEAFKWMRWAAEEKGDAQARGLLGCWYMDGKGVPQDKLEGYKWFRRAYETCIEQGVNVEASKALLVKADAKISLLTGGAGPSDDGDGLEAELRRLAEAGDEVAGFLLGQTLMARGEEAEAVKWMRWAAEEKVDAEAMNVLGRWYLESKGVRQDELEGHKWTRRACETAIERGVDVETNTASLAACDAHICRLSGGPDVSSVNRTAVKKVKARLEEDPDHEGLASMLEELRLDRVCDGCGASARDEDVRLSICTRCRQAFFCSQACLERSYERHEPDCTRLRAQRKRERVEAREKEAARERADGESAGPLTE